MELLNTEINKVIYINLEEATERKKNCLNILKSIFDENKIIRFNAVKDKYLGATKSHIGCLELAIKNKWENVLIVEDDISIYKQDQNLKSLNILKKLLKKKYDVIILGGTFILYNPFNNNLYSCNSGTAYIVNSHYYKVLKNNFEEGLNKIINNMNIENFKYRKYIFDSYWRKLQIKDSWKIVYPPIFYQKNNFSYVNDSFMEHENAFHKRNMILLYSDIRPKLYHLYLFLFIFFFDIEQIYYDTLIPFIYKYNNIKFNRIIILFLFTCFILSIHLRLIYKKRIEI